MVALLVMIVRIISLNVIYKSGVFPHMLPANSRSIICAEDMTSELNETQRGGIQLDQRLFK